jgi:hypothetical protein
MRHNSSPTRLIALAALAYCGGSAQANDAFDLIHETMGAAFQLAPVNPDEGFFIMANGTMTPGEVVTGVRDGTGEQALLVIEDSISTVEQIGLSDSDPIIGTDGFREHVRQLHGTLIGTGDVIDVTILAIPNPDSIDGWALLPTSADASFFEGIDGIDFSETALLSLDEGLETGPDMHVDDGETSPPSPTPQPTPFDRFCLDSNGEPIYPAPYGRPFCICNRFFNCHLSLQAYPGMEPVCNVNPTDTGIPECMRAALCRWKKCVWAAASNDALCRCEAIKASCRGYKRKFGEDPGPMWRGRANTSSCWGAAESLACSVLLGAEELACLWPF